MKKKFLTLTAILFFCTLLSCNSSKLPVKDLVITTADGSTYTVNAEIAKTNEDRMKGYMEREKIPEGTGMLFIFENDQVLSFWMKNTPTPLSIAYIDSKGKIRDIFDMKPYCLDSIMSSVSVRYALEVPQGWFKKNNINPGDYIDLSDF